MHQIQQCRSTMDLAWDLFSQSRLPIWSSVMADTQTSGRGQLGRTWFSPAGNLYASVRLPCPHAPWQGIISLLIGRSLADVLTGFGLSPSVKWPNDILVHGKKVAGILVEQRSGDLVAGIGINLVSAPGTGELRHPLSPEASHLGEFGSTMEPMELWTILAGHLRCSIQRILNTNSPEECIRDLVPHMAFMGENVLADAFEGASQPVHVKSIDPGGGLVVRTPQGERIIRSGSIYPLE